MVNSSSHFKAKPKLFKEALAHIATKMAHPPSSYSLLQCEPSASNTGTGEEGDSDMDFAYTSTTATEHFSPQALLKQFEKNAAESS